jgi:hypothetical protein
LFVSISQPYLIRSLFFFRCFQGDGYWASYNNPYYYDIARITGQYELCLEDPNNCYANDPRAVIFREHQANVRSVGDLKWLMTLNDYETEPASKGDPCNVTALLLWLHSILTLSFSF